MKKYLIFTLALFLNIGMTAENVEKDIKSTIKHVTVFKKGAQVSREAKANISAGNSYLKFTGISPNIDKRSIQVKADGKFTLMAVVHQLNYFEEAKTTAQIDSLLAKQKGFTEQISIDRALLQVYKEEESLILTNKSIGGQQTGVRIDELKATADFYRSRLKEIKLEVLTINKRIAQTQGIINRNAAQLGQLNANRGKHTSEIVLAVNAKVATTASFLLSYVVQNAGWFANYDVRVKNIQSPIQLMYKASVYQTSGEDWKDIKLTLSTGDINQSGTKPILSPWYLRFNSVASNARYQAGAYSGLYSGNTKTVNGRITDEYGEALIGANVFVKGTSSGTVTDLDGNYQLQLPPNAQTLVVSYTGYQSLETNINSANMNLVLSDSGISLNEVTITALGGKVAGLRNASASRQKRKSKKKDKMVAPTQPVQTQTKQNTTTVEFAIDLPYTIPADGKQNLVNIKQHELKAYYEYFCVPKLDTDAFLTAQVTDWEDYYLLNGEANLFFEGTFVGKSYLDVENTEDTLHISLGRDKSIVVKRTRMKDFMKRQFIGTKKTQTRAWEIEIRNKKSYPINLVVEDQFPVSTNKLIEVQHESYDGASFNKTTGILKWKLNLQGGEERKLDFRYSIKYPKKQAIVLE